MSRDDKALVNEIAKLCPKHLEKKHMGVTEFRHLKELFQKHKIKEEVIVVRAD